ncbi:MAG: hypothetical protein KDC81_11740 [Flavobacteriaceae bacterium]|nr:hypothetical protein [Flavobacteriaceae bacterium]
MLNKETIKLGYQQRNELVSHVYSDYNNDEKLLNKKSEWERAVQEHKVTKWIFDLFRDKRDLYGYFENPDDIIKEIRSLIEQSEEKELYEIAGILKLWYDKLRQT